MRSELYFVRSLLRLFSLQIYEGERGFQYHRGDALAFPTCVSQGRNNKGMHGSSGVFIALKVFYE